MRHIISLQRECAEQFSDIYDDGDMWFAGSDPENGKVGSGGGTAWILYQAYREYCINFDADDNAEAERPSFYEWLRSDRSLVLHGGGLSRRLPAYGALGKPLIPIPIFRWAQGQKLNQTLLDLQLPLLENILKLAGEGRDKNLASQGKDNSPADAGKNSPSAKDRSQKYSRPQERQVNAAAASLKDPEPRSLVLIASGDVLIRTDVGIEEIPEADVINFGVSIDPETAMHHGVFVCDRKNPGRMISMLQKPSLKQIQQLALDHLFFMDVGICLLSERAVRVLMKKSGWDDASGRFIGSQNSRGIPNDGCRDGGGIPNYYDFYGAFGPSLGSKPTFPDPDTSGLTTAVVEIPGGEFYHFGRTRDVIESSLALQHRISDQKRIWHKHVKPHPSMFIQNAVAERGLTEENRQVWIESSYIPDAWRLRHDHCLTGIPGNRWELDLPARICISMQQLNPSTIADMAAALTHSELDDNAASPDMNSMKLADIRRKNKKPDQSRFSVQSKSAESHVKSEKYVKVLESVKSVGTATEAVIQDAARKRKKQKLKDIGESSAVNAEKPGKAEKPAGEGAWVFQFYGMDDAFRGAPDDDGTTFLNMPFREWLDSHGLELKQLICRNRGPRAESRRNRAEDIFSIPLFPVISDETLGDISAGELFQWLITAHPSAEQNRRFTNDYSAMTRCSAAEILDWADLRAQEVQRRALRARVWPIIARNYRRSVMYQVDLDHAAREFAEFGLELPPELPDDEDPMILIHDAMFRDRYESWKLKLSHDDSDLQDLPEASVYRDRAFKHLQQSILEPFRDRERCVNPSIHVFDDQIIWGRSPVRIDLAGGWTDTPPYSLIMGGAVVTAALELNGQPPIQVFIRKTAIPPINPAAAIKTDKSHSVPVTEVTEAPASETQDSASAYPDNSVTKSSKPTSDTHDQPTITLRSIDLGLREEVTCFADLEQVNLVGSAFAIPKAALTLSGFHPDYCSRSYASLADQLRQMGGGLEISFLAAIPKGSGMGTSSVLGATILGSLSEFCGLHWDYSEIGMRTLGIEQLLTTGGGWQDQYGGIIPGLKLLETGMGLDQTPKVRWLPDMLFTRREFQESLLLYYTGVTRVAKNILAEIVQGMFLNERERFAILAEMKRHAVNTFDVIQLGDFEGFGRMIARSWELNKRLDSGTTSPEIEAILDKIDDLALGYKLPGAGGGGYMFIVARNPEAARTIRDRLDADPPNSRARFVDVRLSTSGLQISRS